VSLWEVTSGRQRGVVAVGRSVPAIAFSPEGRLLAYTVGNEETLTLRDLASGEILGQIRCEIDHPTSLAFSPDGTRLAVAGSSATGLVYDVAALCNKDKARPVFKVTEPPAELLEELWLELIGSDGERAYRGVLGLSAVGPRAAGFLKARLKSGPDVDERRITQLIAELDKEEYAAREKASRALEGLGARAEPALRQTLEGKVSTEARTRIKRLLGRLGSAHEAPSTQVIHVRVIEALEINGSAEARNLLAELAKGPSASLIVQEAKASLQRLSARPATKQ
jgi:hypothetical protein